MAYLRWWVVSVGRGRHCFCEPRAEPRGRGRAGADADLRLFDVANGTWANQATATDTVSGVGVVNWGGQQAVGVLDDGGLSAYTFGEFGDAPTQLGQADGAVWGGGGASGRQTASSTGISLGELEMATLHSLVAVLVGLAVQAQGPKGQLPTDHEIREMLGAEDNLGGEQGVLIALGERAFPAYLRILAAKDADRREVSQIFIVLSKVKADRGPFLEHAVANLSHPHRSVRWAAVQLLGQIGSERDTAPVVALLADEAWEVPFAAAKALAATGDRRALVAMDVWLNSGNRKDDRVMREQVAKYRDELKERLDKAKKPGK